MTDTNGNIRTALTNGFGYYRFDQVEVGGVYILSVEAKQHHFENPTRTINVVDELTDVNFVALPSIVADLRVLDLSFPSHLQALRRPNRESIY